VPISWWAARASEKPVATVHHARRQALAQQHAALERVIVAGMVRAITARPAGALDPEASNLNLAH
jgi:hypothetical protein